MFRAVRVALFSVLVALSASSAIAAEAYPQKPIRLILPFAAGGATDVLARAVSARLEEVLGASVIIDNRGGAGGTLGTALAARAAPDGYTFLFTSASHTFTPSLYKDLPYDPLKDFKAITMFASIPNLLVVHPSMPAKSVKELLALARRHPGEIRFSSGGHGSNIHLTTELFAYMARIKLEHVPYKGGGPGQVAVMSGEVQLMLPAINSAFPFVKSGRMRALGVSTKARSPALPELPTIDESGVPGYDKASWFALFAPAAVPEAITNQVYQAAVRVLKNPEIVKLLAAEGAVAVGNTPAEFDAFVRSELVAWAKLIREMGLAR
jgi:tripartite-type tricarboxylate transporter receptor subunit TctC